MESVSPSPLHLDKLDDAQLGLTIQDNGKLFEFSKKCCSIFHKCYELKQMMLSEDGLGLRPSHVDKLVARCENHKTKMKWYGCVPNRCSKHNKRIKTFQRTKDLEHKLASKFEQRRHHHIRMATIGMPGQKVTELNKVEKSIVEWRTLIKEEFCKLRKRSIWKTHVDGGMYFFECTITPIGNGQVKINPHLHMVLLCPKKFPIVQMNNYLASLTGITLGRFHISTPRDKQGRIKKCRPIDAIGYCTSYMKEEQQLDGKNRQRFGNLLK